MKFTIRQELALKHPVLDGDESIDARHLAQRGYNEVLVRNALTIDRFEGGSPVWHISISVQTRDGGSALRVRQLSKRERWLLRSIAEEELEGVGDGYGEWEIDEQVLHLTRRLTPQEEEMLP